MLQVRETIDEGRKKQLSLDRPATYQIKVPGHLDESWIDWARSMMNTVESKCDGPRVKSLTSTVDQAALHSLLRRLYSLSLPLSSVNCVEPG